MGGCDDADTGTHGNRRRRPAALHPIEKPLSITKEMSVSDNCVWSP